MNYLSMKAILELMATKSYKELIKAILSFETTVEDEVILEKVYEFYFNEDGVTLLNEELKERLRYEEQCYQKIKRSCNAPPEKIWRTANNASPKNSMTYCCMAEDRLVQSFDSFLKSRMIFQSKPSKKLILTREAG